MISFNRKTSRLPTWAARTAQALLVAGVVCFGLGATDPNEHFNKLGGQLMCSCGCAQQLLGCDHVGCPNRAGEMEQLRRGISAGDSDALILKGFVQQYGATVLAAPTMEGFDLVAWIMPFAVSALGLIGTIFLVRHWAKNQPQLARNRVLDPAHIPADATMQERIRRETET